MIDYGRHKHLPNSIFWTPILKIETKIDPVRWLYTFFKNYNTTLSKEIYNRIQYLCDYNDFKTIKTFLVECMLKINYITTKIKVKSYFDENTYSETIYLYRDSQKDAIFPIDIKNKYISF